jgi:hypothetical protein
VPAAVVTRDNIADDVRREMHILLAENTNAQVARMLNERGLRTSTGGDFNPVIVRWVLLGPTDARTRKADRGS